MNDCNQSYEKSGKKGVTFDAMETLERQCESMVRLTSQVSKMNVKMDKKKTPYKPKVYQNRHRGQGRGRQSNCHPQNQSFSRDQNRNEGNYHYNDRNSR